MHAEVVRSSDLFGSRSRRAPGVDDGIHRRAIQIGEVSIICCGPAEEGQVFPTEEDHLNPPPFHLREVTDDAEQGER